MKYNVLKSFFTACILSISVTACTDIEPESLSNVTPDNFFNSEDDFKASISSVYESIGGFTWFNYLYCVEANSDAICTPSRIAPAGWEDGGTHRKIELHGIEPNQGWPINEVYTNIMLAISRANVSINGITNSKAAVSSQIKGRYLDEARILRAYIYWLAMDLFGDVPLVKTFQDYKNPIGNTPRVEIFEFLTEELKSVIANGYVYNNIIIDGKHVFPRLTVMTAKALLAKIYLNGEVYTGKPYYTEALVQLNDLINNKASYGIGLYTGNYHDMFRIDNFNSKFASEFLFFHDISPVRMANFAGIGWAQFSLPQNMKTRAGMNAEPWNGACLEKHFVDTFDPDDIRYKLGVLDGPVFEADGVTPIKGKTSGLPLVITRDFPLIGAADYQGCRITKWQGDNKSVGQRPNNGWPIIRFSDVLLMAAECELRTNGSQSKADSYVNSVRARVFNPAKPLTNVTLNDLYNERGRELFSEGHRRIDQIRFKKWGDGDFNTNPDFKSDAHTQIWPFPTTQLEVNRNLRQNPGYN